MLHPLTSMLLLLWLFLGLLAGWHRSKDYDQATMGFRAAAVFSFLTMVYGLSCLYHIRTSRPVTSAGAIQNFEKWKKQPGGAFRLATAQGSSPVLYFDAETFHDHFGFGNAATVQATYIPYFRLVTEVRDGKGTLLHKEGDGTTTCLLVVALGLGYLIAALWKGAPVYRRPRAPAFP